MIVVDTSALIAIVLGEPERIKILDVLDGADGIAVSAATVIEARMVLQGRGGQPFVVMLDELVRNYDMEIVPPDTIEIDAAHEAFVRFGKGSGHPAQLNFGDLFSYALAKTHGVPLLYKGNDFAQTDIEPASSLE